MVSISQKTVKHDFIGPSGGNQRKKLRSFDYFYAKQSQFPKKSNERKAINNNEL